MDATFWEVLANEVLKRDLSGRVVVVQQQKDEGKGESGRQEPGGWVGDVVVPIALIGVAPVASLTPIAEVAKRIAELVLVLASLQPFREEVSEALGDLLHPPMESRRQHGRVLRCAEGKHLSGWLSS